MRVGKKKLAVIYEGVGLLCFHCGKIGHCCEWCPIRAPEEIKKPMVNVQSRSEEEDKPKGFGPWMLVTRQKRQMKPAVSHKDGTANGAFERAVGYDDVLGCDAHQNDLVTNDHTAGSSVVQRRDKTNQVDLSANDHAASYSTIQRSDKAQQFDHSTNNHAAGYLAVQRHDKPQNFDLSANQHVVGSSDMQGRDKTKHHFWYSPLDKGKSKKLGGAKKLYSHGLSKSDSMPVQQISFSGLSESIQIPEKPVFVFYISNPGVNSLQSQPSNQITHAKEKPLSFTSPQQPLASSSAISLRPHLPKSKAGNDKHSMGGVPVVQSISKLKDSAGRSVHSDRRRCDRVDPKGPTPHVGLVRHLDSSSMDRNSFSSRSRRSTSPNRHGLVARDKPVLEFPNGQPENQWDSLSTKSSLSAIAGAAICPIYGGGLLCNTAGI